MEINCLKDILAQQQRTNRWLAKELDVNEVTVSRWCNNVSQPNLATLVAIAQLLDVDVKDLILSTKNRTL